MRRYGLFIIAGVFIVGLFGIGQLTSKESPDEIFQHAMRDFFSHESFAGDIFVETLFDVGVLGIDLGPSAPPRIPLGLSGNIEVRLEGEKGFIAYGDLGVSVDSMEPSKDAPHFEVMSEGQDGLYIRATQLPEQGTPVFALSDLNDTWFTFSPEEFTAIEDGESDKEEVVDGILEEVSLIVIEQFLTESGVFSVASRAESEVIGGRDSDHFILQYVEEGATEFAAALMREYKGRYLTPEESLSLKQSMDELSIHAEVWVDKETKQLRKFGFDLRPKKDSMRAPVRIIVEIDSYDARVSHQVPKSADSLIDILTKKLIGNF